MDDQEDNKFATVIWTGVVVSAMAIMATVAAVVFGFVSLPIRIR